MSFTDTILIPLSDGVDTVSLKHVNIMDGTAETITNFTNVDSYTKLLLKLNSDFSDSTNLHSPAARNNATITTVSPIWEAGSALFTGSDSISIPDDNDFYWPGDFTIDFWFRPSSISAQDFFGQNDSYTPVYLSMLGSGVLYLWVSNGSGWQIAQGGTTALVANNSYHIAVERFGNRWRVYINGTADIDVTQAVTLFDSNRDFRIGTWRFDSGGLIGRLDEFRLSKGIARYQGNFTPPTGPYSIYATSASPAALAKSLPIGTVIKWSTARVVPYRNGVAQTSSSTDYKMQKAINNGTYNGTWLTLAGLRTLPNDTITTATNSVKVQGQYNSDTTYQVSTFRALTVDVDFPSGGPSGGSKYDKFAKYGYRRIGG